MSVIMNPFYFPHRLGVAVLLLSVSRIKDDTRGSPTGRLEIVEVEAMKRNSGEAGLSAMEET